jgi:ribosomal protein S18 acetylase RimI-like enzyme
MERFRFATEDDIDSIVEMMCQFHVEEGYHFEEAEAMDAALALIQNDNLGRLWVTQEDNHVVGYLAVTLGFSFEFCGRDAFIDELYIREENRGRGLGSEALDIAEEYCRSLGVKALHLEVEHHRKAAQKLYLRAGFKNNNRNLMTKWLNDPG